MREEIKVFYELEIADRISVSTIEFEHVFDKEIYKEDVEATDIMMVNLKMEELKEKHGDIFLIEFNVSREGDLFHE